LDQEISQDFRTLVRGENRFLEFCSAVASAKPSGNTTKAPP
jgi:hypothetical protein